MVLLDLSAAFDTIDHAILLKRRRNVFGIDGTALTWLRSYLSGRTFRVKVEKSLSDTHSLKFGVPQGSVLGPLLFSCYTHPLANIMHEHGLNSHLFADDSQNWQAFQTTPPSSLPFVMSRVEACLSRFAS
jgi:retron-type reverse transcriptase